MSTKLDNSKPGAAAPGPASEPAAAATTTAAVRGASMLITLQVAARAATFVANQVLLRYLTAQLLGVATQLEVYYLSVLFFARESLRVAIQRRAGEDDDGSDAETDEARRQKRQRAAQAAQSAVNLAYVSIALGGVVAAALGWLYLRSVGDGGARGNGDAIASTPFLRPALYLYAAAAMLELLSEPAFVVLQLRLRFGARAAAESTATALRCAATLGTAVLAARRGIDAGVLPFALGQLAYGAGLLAVYAWHGQRLARAGGFLLVPAAVQRGATQVETPEKTPETPETPGQTTYVCGYFDPATLHLASSMTAQSVVKHILTQGDTFLVSVLSTPTAQGVYALANNYGGLAARLLFQPIEESSRSYFSRLLAHADKHSEAGADKAAERAETTETAETKSTARASRDLWTLLRVYMLLSLVVAALGPAAAAPLLALVTGPRWARWAGAGAAPTLAAYVWYIPLLAANGVAEAFVASVATRDDVHRQSAWMAVFSAVFAGTGFVFLRTLGWGAAGLVAANAVNMACRIAWCTVFVRRYFSARGVAFPLGELLPRPLAFLAAVVASGAVRRVVPEMPLAEAARAAETTGALVYIMQLAKIAAVAVPFVLYVAFSERKFFRQCYSFVRDGQPS